MEAYCTCHHICHLQAILISGVSPDNILKGANTFLLFATLGESHAQKPAKRWRRTINNQYFIGNIEFTGTKGQVDEQLGH